MLSRLHFTLLFCLIAASPAFGQSMHTVASSYADQPWSIRMAESEMKRSPTTYKLAGMDNWDYVVGTALRGFEAVWRFSGDARYYAYIKNTIDAVVNSSGTIAGYAESNYSLDEINEGKLLLLLHANETSNSRYRIAAATLRKQLANHPKIAEGGFWHKKGYPNQMWLDGIYMASPYLAGYGTAFSQTADIDTAVRQFTLLDAHAWESSSSLYYHAWDASKTMAWANSVSGCSPSFWGRALGWYALALVDAIEQLPSGNAGKTSLTSILQRVASGIRRWQDPVSGTWYQVLDQGNRVGNYHEASASCMFVYTLAKGIRLGVLDSTFLPAARLGYQGVVQEFISVNADSTINLDRICQSAGLGGTPYRDGSFEYYANLQTSSPTPIVSNDGKGTGPFMMASVEMERSGYVLPPTRFEVAGQGDVIVVRWTDRAYNGVSVIIERRQQGSPTFLLIADVPKGTTSYTDRPQVRGVSYIYRGRTRTLTSYSEYTLPDSAQLTTDVQRANVSIPEISGISAFPNPFNPSTTAKVSIPREQHIVLRLFDQLGREVAVLADNVFGAGTYNFRWDGGSFSAGIYYLRCLGEGWYQTVPIVLLK